MKRTLYFKLIEQLHHKNALIITGMRQVGKTTLAKYIYDEISAPKLWYDFDNPLDLLPFEKKDYNQIYYELSQLASHKKGEKLYVFIDEIQNFPEITKIMKYLIDYHKVKFIVTGSSNYYIRNLFPESLSGRKFLYLLQPLSFREFLYFKGIITEKEIQKVDIQNVFFKPSEYEYTKRSLLYDEYIEFGGFPEVVTTEDIDTKKLILKNIFASFFEKDIKVFTELKDVRELRDLILLLAPRNANILDVSKLSSELGVNRVKVYAYLEFLQSIFFLTLLPRFSRSIDRSVAAGRKVYFSDTGILNLISKVTEGQLYEVSVYNQLSEYGNLSFYNKRNVSEIDFIIDNQYAFEVKTNPVPNDYKKLQNQAEVIGINSFSIISRKYNEFQNTVFPQFV
jgi:predicted AAA+ superfamily ATPase